MSSYESESKLEEKLISQLSKQGYEIVKIDDVQALEKNFREQINKHNKIELNGKDLSDKDELTSH